MNSQTTFTFKSHEINLSKGEALFKYRLSLEDQNIDFTEKILFPPVLNLDIPKRLINNILDSLLLILGISYWKLYCPEKIVLESITLSKEQAEFWSTVYTKGLGEFFYRNKIDYRGLVQFPFNSKAERSEILSWSSPLQDDKKYKNRSLLTIGGGKDSIVTGEYLIEQNQPFDVLLIGDSYIQQKVSKLMGKTPIVIKRELDPKLFELNKNEGSFNGHIPISVVYAFLSLFAGALYDYKYIIVSNEKSADIGNVEYLGSIVNHQWSKSAEFEKLFTDYVEKYISPNLHYYSPLRDLTEMKIAQIFLKYDKYFAVFSSCNRNFKINRENLDSHFPSKRTSFSEAVHGNDRGENGNDNGRWCGECPKCAFVFTLLSAFLSKSDLDKIFGKNLYKDESLLPLFKELLGIKDFKPFECVGTPEEMALAMHKAYKNGEFDGDYIMEMFKKEILPKNYNWEEMEKDLLSGEIKKL